MYDQINNSSCNKVVCMNARMHLFWANVKAVEVETLICVHVFCGVVVPSLFVMAT